MSTTPTDTTTEPAPNEPTVEQALRLSALQHASFLSSKDTPVERYLQVAAFIEQYLLDGTQPPKEK